MSDLSFFHRYDIRGLYGKEITPETLFYVGKALFRALSPRVIVLGTDTREVSLKVKQGLLSSLGGKIIDIGVCSTPVFYLNVIRQKADLGVMITASHLGSFFTGIKIVKENSTPLSPQEIEDLKKAYLKVLREDKKKEEKGAVVVKLQRADIERSYLSFLRTKVKRKAFSLPVYFDSGGGTASLYFRVLQEGFRFSEESLFFSPDPVFPFYRPSNPYNSKVQDFVKERLLSNKLFLGCAFDSDADRVAFFDMEGEIIHPAIAGTFLSLVFKKRGHKTLVVDERFSMRIQRYLENKGLRVVRSLSWHPNIKKAMRKYSAYFGFEISGHFIFAPFYIDDGILVSLVFLSVLEKTGYRELERFLSDMRTRFYVLPQFSIPFNDKAQEFTSKIKRHFKTRNLKIREKDGISVYSSRFFFNIRASLTEPVLKINIEAENKELAESLKEDILSLLA